MADAVARTRVPDSEAAASALQEEMVLCVQIIDLQKVMIDILRAELGTTPVEVHRFQRQHDQRSRGVLRERLVDPDRDRRTRTRVAIEEMRRDQLLGDVPGHAQTLAVEEFFTELEASACRCHESKPA